MRKAEPGNPARHLQKNVFFLVHSEQEPCEISSTQGGGGGGGIGGGCSSLPEFSELQSEIA